MAQQVQVIDEESGLGGSDLDHQAGSGDVVAAAGRLDGVGAH